MSDYYTDHLLRLPFYNSLQEADLEKITSLILSFYQEHTA
jgi:hypothetical protein